MMVGNNLKETQLQQIVDKTILLYDKVFSLLFSSILNPWKSMKIYLWQGPHISFSSIVPIYSFPPSLKIYVNRTILLYDKVAGRNLSSKDNDNNYVNDRNLN